MLIKILLLCSEDLDRLLQWLFTLNQSTVREFDRMINQSKMLVDFFHMQISSIFSRYILFNLLIAFEMKKQMFRYWFFINVYFQGLMRENEFFLAYKWKINVSYSCQSKINIPPLHFRSTYFLRGNRRLTKTELFIDYVYFIEILEKSK